MKNHDKIEELLEFSENHYLNSNLYTNNKKKPILDKMINEMDEWKKINPQVIYSKLKFKPLTKIRSSRPSINTKYVKPKKIQSCRYNTNISIFLLIIGNILKDVAKIKSEKKEVNLLLTDESKIEISNDLSSNIYKSELSIKRIVDTRKSINLKKIRSTYLKLKEQPYPINSDNSYFFRIENNFYKNSCDNNEIDLQAHHSVKQLIKKPSLIKFKENTKDGFITKKLITSRSINQKTKIIYDSRRCIDKKKIILALVY